MKEYHKIETVFNRDTEGTKKLIDGSFRNEAIEMLQNINWIWTEKVDGTNIRIHWDGHKVEFGGRTERAQIPVDLVNFLNAKFKNPETEELFEQKFGNTDVILFGEGYGKKIQGVGSLYRPDDVSFILFDVSIGEVWLKRGSVEDVAKSFGVDIVPIVGVGTIREAIDFVKNQPVSALSAKAPMEGIVARPECELFDRMGRRLIVKIKANDFKKKIKELTDNAEER